MFSLSLGTYVIGVRPSTILKFHRYLVRRKYSRLFGTKTKGRIGRPEIPEEIRKLVIEIKLQNPRFGCPQIASIVKDRVGLLIGIETVRRILRRHLPPHNGDGPSWLTFLAQQRDSLWSTDLFRVESITLQTHWVMVTMDQFSRKIIGIRVTKGSVTGANLCYMFNQIVSESCAKPKRLSHDNDPLFHYHQWLVNLDMLEIDSVRSIPYTPTSHPFVERLIGTIRREFTDHILFWNQNDLEKKLTEYAMYFEI